MFYMHLKVIEMVKPFIVTLFTHILTSSLLAAVHEQQYLTAPSHGSHWYY